LALVAEGTKSLSLLVQTRGEPRALVIAAVSGVALGLAVGAAFLGGRVAADATHHAQSARLSAAVRRGLSDAALQHGATSVAPNAGAAAIRAAPAQPVPARSALLHAAVLQASTPFRLAGPVEASRDLDCLTAAVYYEARGETAAGQAAVAQVVLNRVRHPAFPKTVCGVVYQGAAGGQCQFSFACDGAMRRGKEPAAWDRARDVASRALSGYVMQGVGRATHFHVASLGGLWGAGMVRVAQVGQHIFYSFGGHRSQLSSGPAQPSADTPDGLDVTTVAAVAPADGGRLASADPAPTPPSTTDAKPVSAAPPGSAPAAASIATPTVAIAPS
jgi:spore germination cell wall hydrolase CwlJ-like protein